MGFLLHSDRSRVMEKKLTNSGPLRESADKHSIYAIKQCYRHCSGPSIGPQRVSGLSTADSILTSYQILQGLAGVSREKGLTRVASTATMRPIYDRPVIA